VALSEPDPEFEAFAAIAERIDLAAEVATQKAVERDKKVHRSRSRSWLEHNAFKSRLATRIFKVQNDGSVQWPLEKVREWLTRLGLERDYIDDIEHEVALRHYRLRQKDAKLSEETGGPILILGLPPEHPGRRRKRLRKEKNKRLAPER
jgi:hypothetical protein